MSSVKIFENLPYGIWLYMKQPHCWRVDLTYLKPDCFLVDPPTEPFMKELHVLAGMNESVNLDKLTWYFYNGSPPHGVDVKDPLDILFIAVGEYKDKSLSDLLRFNLPSEEWSKVGQKMPLPPA
jgi:hypothetical protein